MRSRVVKLGYGMAFVAAIAYAFVTMRGPHGISNWIETRQEVHDLEQRNAALARENLLRKEANERLRDVKADQDLEIGRRLKLVKPNEKIYIKKPGN